MGAADIWWYIIEGCLLSWCIINDALSLFKQLVDIADVGVGLLLRASNTADVILARMLILILLIRVRYSPLSLLN